MIESGSLNSQNRESLRLIFGGGGPRHGHRINDENARVNRMNPQQFSEYMNELHLRDSKKPLKKDVLS